mmetsp:Transcript_6457/g.9830  ORF Transcript_6457/g.9830 Transcript_6457/m.9830 type:complete len:87 (+) Transcript_6457:1132-1392(+)
MSAFSRRVLCVIHVRTNRNSARGIATANNKILALALSRTPIPKHSIRCMKQNPVIIDLPVKHLENPLLLRLPHEWPILSVRSRREG